MMDGYTFSWIVVAVLVGNGLWYSLKALVDAIAYWWDQKERKADQLISPWDTDGESLGALRAQPGEENRMPGPRVDGGLPASGSSVLRPSDPS